MEWNTVGVILLSIVQKVGYDHATHDQKKAVEVFVLGEDVFLQTKSDSPSRGLGSVRIEQGTQIPRMASYPTTVGE